MNRAESSRVLLAERHAAITGYLSSNEGEHSIRDIHSKSLLDIPFKGLQKLLAEMAFHGLIASRKVKTAKLYRSANLQDETRILKHPRDQEPTRRKNKTTTTQNVELVVSGYTVVLGRNPATGNLRIVIEEKE